MEVFILVVFILGYLAITLEHSLKIDKLIPALVMMAFAWAGVAFGLDSFTSWFDPGSHHLVEGFSNLPLSGVHGEMSKMDWMEETLLHHFGKTCEILIFLVGAMTIVEIIDHFNGFQTFKAMISTRKNQSFCGLFVFLLSFYLQLLIT